MYSDKKLKKFFPNSSIILPYNKQQPMQLTLLPITNIILGDICDQNRIHNEEFHTSLMALMFTIALDVILWLIIMIFSIVLITIISVALPFASIIYFAYFIMKKIKD